MQYSNASLQDVNGQQQVLLRTWLQSSLPALQAELLSKQAPKQMKTVDRVEELQPWIELLDGWPPSLGQRLLKLVKTPSAQNFEEIDAFLHQAIEYKRQLQTLQLRDEALRPLVLELMHLIMVQIQQALAMLEALASAIESANHPEPLNLQVAAADTTQFLNLLHAYQVNEMQKVGLVGMFNQLENKTGVLMVILGALTLLAGLLSWLTAYPVFVMVMGFIFLTVVVYKGVGGLINTLFK